MPEKNANESIDRHITVDVFGMRPRLRDDLILSIQDYAGKTCYLLEDELTGNFFRFGIAEYTLISCLDGSTSVAEAIGRTGEVCGGEGLDETEAVAFCKWLLDHDLAHTDQSCEAGRMHEARERKSAKRSLAQVNPIVQRIPLLNPMPLLRPLDVLARHLFGVSGIIVWLAVTIVACISIIGSWDTFTSSREQIFARDNWIALAATWLALKLIHEIGHAIASRRFGVHVREAGLVLILFAPMPYVDVTRAWRLDNKWARIFISAAGMYAEIFVASAAAILWSYSFDPLLRQQAMNIIVTATLTTIVFNANPLMRFDGYYILTDFLEMPNLATNGRRWMSYASRRYLLGMDIPRPNWSEGAHGLIVAYAVAACLWRILVSVLLIISAEVLFYGAGKIIALAAGAIWVGVPVYRMLRTAGSASLICGKRGLVGVATIAAILFLTGSLVPWYSRSTVPLVVDHHPQHEVRTSVSGFLDRSFIVPGDHVVAGEILARLSNRELELEFENLSFEVAKSESRHRQFLAEGLVSAAGVERRRLSSLNERRNQIESQLQKLLVRSPVSGIVLMSDLDHREATYFDQGTRLAVVASEGDKRIVGLIDQPSVEAFREVGDETIEVSFWGAGRTRVRAKVERVFPRATDRLDYPALAAPAGGPLAVMEDPDAETDRQAWKLIVPRVTLILEPDPEDAKSLLAGQTGYARLSYRNGTLGQTVWNSVSGWIEEKRSQLR